MNTTEHLLTCLAEEGAEVAHDCHKSLRFGLDDRNVLNPTGPTNRERIIKELNDLMGVVSMLVMKGILPPDWLNQHTIDAKVMRIVKFMNYARDVGTLEGPICV